MDEDFALALALINGAEQSFDSCPLQPGVHLRWSFSRYLPYPRAGFLIERRIPWLDEFGVGAWNPVATVKLPTADIPLSARRSRAVVEARSRIEKRLLGAFTGRHDDFDAEGLIDMLLPAWPRSTEGLNLAPRTARGPGLSTRKLELLWLAALDPRAATALGMYYVDPLPAGVRADYRVTALWGSEIWPWTTGLAANARELDRSTFELADVRLESDRRFAFDDTRRTLLLEGSSALPLLMELPVPVKRVWVRITSTLGGDWFLRCFDASGRRLPDARIESSGFTVRIEAGSTRLKQIELGQVTSGTAVWTLYSLSFQIEEGAIANRALERSVRLLPDPASPLHVEARPSTNVHGVSAVAPELQIATGAVEVRVSAGTVHPTFFHVVRERIGSLVPEHKPLTYSDVPPGPVPHVLARFALDGTDSGITREGTAAFSVGAADRRAVLELLGGFAVLRDARLRQIGRDFVVELWVRPWPSSGTILAYNGTRRISLDFDPRTLRLTVVIDGSGFESRAILTAQHWTHIALAVQGQMARLYVDGRLDATRPVGEASGSPSDRFVLGAPITGSARGRFYGHLADLVVIVFALPSVNSPSPDLAGAWSLDGHMRGWHSGFDLVPRGSPRFVLGHPELATRRVLQLDGESWLTAPSLRGLAGFDTELTLEAWVRPDAGQHWPTIVGNDWQRSVWFGLTPGDYRLRFRVNGGIYESRTGIPVRGWSHVAASTDGRNVSLWVDGRLDVVHAGLIGPIVPNAHTECTIGADGDAFRFLGAIADIRVWRSVPRPPVRTLLVGHPLVAEWTLDGEVRETGRGLESVVVGSASFEAGHPLDSKRNVLLLDGSTFVEVAQPFTLKEVSSEFTLDAWVRPSRGSAQSTIVGQESTNGFWLGLTREGSAKLRIDGREFLSRSRVSSGVWSRVTASYDGTQVRFFLQDARHDAVHTAALGIVRRVDGPLRIGADRGSSPGRPVSAFRGALADVRIFSRALDPTQCDRGASSPAPPLAFLDPDVPNGRFRYAVTPADAFGRLGARTASAAVSIGDLVVPPPPQAVRAQFRPLTGTIVSVIADPTTAPTVTVVTDIALPSDPTVRDRVLTGLVRYDATITGALAGRTREEQFLIQNARVAGEGRLTVDVKLPPLARLFPNNAQGIRIEYDARLEVRWAWTGLQRVTAPDVSTFRIYHRAGSADAIESLVAEVAPDPTDPELFFVTAQLASAPRRIDPSDWIGRYCLIGSHRYRIETAVQRGITVEFTLRYLARPVIAPERGARLVFAVPLDPSERDDGARWEGRRTIVAETGRLPPEEQFQELRLQPVSEEAYVAVRGELGEATPPRERLLMTALPPDASAPRPDEPEGALLGFSMDERDWGWRVLRVIAARTADGRTSLYLLRPVGLSESRDLVLTCAQHFRGAWLTDTLDIAVTIPSDRGTQPYEVAVSAADRAPTRDARGEPEVRGNESALSSIARAIAVDRQRPPAPLAPSVSFDAADFFGDSRATVDWRHIPLAAHRSVEVHRATDSDVFARDLRQRRRREGPYSPDRLPDPASVFDDDVDFEAWLSARFPSWFARPREHLFVDEPARDVDRTEWEAATEVWRKWTERFYSALSDRDVTALAELPGNEAAFVSVTPKPVKGTQHVDRVRGLADNRFLYRLRTRSASFTGSNRLGQVSVSAEQRTPRIRPPRAPVFTKVDAGNRIIRLDWVLSREPNLAGYRLYRTESGTELEDLRWFGEGDDPRLVATIEDPLIRVRDGEIVLPRGIEIVEVNAVHRLDEFDAARAPAEQTALNYMTAGTIHTEGSIRNLRRIAGGVPIAVVFRSPDGGVRAVSRRSELPPFVDTDVLALRDYYYRLDAVDRFGNASTGSKIVVARAADLAPAPPPIWSHADWVTPAGEAPLVHLEWTVADEGMHCIVQRRSDRDATWRAVGDWIQTPDSVRAEVRFSFDDHGANPSRAYQYRVRVINASGNPNAEHNVVDVPRLET
jgi:hypothetical protein